MGCDSLDVGRNVSLMSSVHAVVKRQNANSQGPTAVMSMYVQSFFIVLFFYWLNGEAPGAVPLTMGGCARGVSAGTGAAVCIVVGRFAYSDGW